MKQFDLNIEKILDNWEVYHALREIIANALDEQILSNTKDIQIHKQSDSIWIIKDFGRGINYHHLTQNENPEKMNNDNIIGRFGVGLKDALATLYRHNIKVEIVSKYGKITVVESSKQQFEDIITLHAQIEPLDDDSIIGTTFYLYGVDDESIEKAKSMFLCFSEETIITSTQYGDIIRKGESIANIYINGVKVSEEPNFAFSYNITSLSKQIKKALNRERTNVGRTAYADRIKSILLETTNEEVLEILLNNLEAMSSGRQCDEIKWIDVASYAVKILNDKKDTIFATPDEIASTSGSTGEIISNSGKKVVFIPENVKKKVLEEDESQITTINTVVREYNDDFLYDFIDVNHLTKAEKDNWEKARELLKKLGLLAWFDKCFISEKLKEDGSDNTVGVWDSELSKIVIKRSQLSNSTELFGTILHEIIHAKTGASDISRYFEYELTSMIGKLATIILAENIEANNTIMVESRSSDSDLVKELTDKYSVLLEKYNALLKAMARR